MEMAKQYVIIDMKGKYCQLLDKRLVVFTSDIKDAQFFDSEMNAYEFMAKYGIMFSEGIQNKFFEIKCIVIVWKELKSK